MEYDRQGQMISVFTFTFTFRFGEESEGRDTADVTPA